MKSQTEKLLNDVVKKQPGLRFGWYSMKSGKVDTSTLILDGTGTNGIRLNLMNPTGSIKADLTAGVAALEKAAPGSGADLDIAMKDLLAIANDNVTNPPPWNEVLTRIGVSVVRAR